MLVADAGIEPAFSCICQKCRRQRLRLREGKLKMKKLAMKDMK